MSKQKTQYSYISESDKKDRRMCRMHNICVWFDNNYSLHKGQALNSKDIRAQIRKDLNIVPNDLYGDHRGHGDAIGRHGLNLEHTMHRDERMIVINYSNLRTCLDWLAAGHLKKKPKSLRLEEGRNLSDEELQKISPRHILYYYIKEGVFVDYPEGMTRTAFIESVADNMREEKMTAAKASQLLVLHLDAVVERIKERERKGLSELFRRMESAKKLAAEGNYEEAFLAIFPDMAPEAPKKDHVLK